MAASNFTTPGYETRQGRFGQTRKPFWRRRGVVRAAAGLALVGSLTWAMQSCSRGNNRNDASPPASNDNRIVNVYETHNETHNTYPGPEPAGPSRTETPPANREPHQATPPQKKESEVPERTTSAPLESRVGIGCDGCHPATEFVANKYGALKGMYLNPFEIISGETTDTYKLHTHHKGHDPEDCTLDSHRFATIDGTGRTTTYDHDVIGRIKLTELQLQEGWTVMLRTAEGLESAVQQEGDVLLFNISQDDMSTGKIYPVLMDPDGKPCPIESYGIMFGRQGPVSHAAAATSGGRPGKKQEPTAPTKTEPAPEEPAPAPVTERLQYKNTVFSPVPPLETQIESQTPTPPAEPAEKEEGALSEIGLHFVTKNYTDDLTVSTTDATPIPGTRLTLGLKGLGLEYRRTSPNTRFSAHADFLGGDFSEPRWGHFRGLDASEKRFDIDAMGRVYGPLYGEAGFGVNSFKIGNGFGTFSHGFGRALQEQTVTDIQGGLGVAFGSLRDDRFHVKFGGLYAQQHQTLNGFSWNNNRLGITGGLNVPFNKGNLLLDYDHWLKISGDLLEGHGTGDRLNAELTVDPGRPGGLGFRFGVSPVDNRFLPYDGTVFRPQKANWGKIYFGVTLLGGDRR